MSAAIRLNAEVKDAIDAGKPVVALESTIFTHGLPRPTNLDVALEGEELVRQGGAVPATIGVFHGESVVGLSKDEITELSNEDDMQKASIRELAYCRVKGINAGTTIAATAHLAAQAGIPVFATGGLGGVHHGASTNFDESADLVALSKTSIVMISSGAKAILDINATLERFESLSVPVLGYRTNSYPGFYVADSGFPVGARLDTPAEIAEMLTDQRSLNIGSGILVANPIPAEEQLNPEGLDSIIESAWADADRDGIKGQAVTPYLLDYIRRATDGESLRANVALYRNNIRLAADVATALASRGQ